MADSDNVKKPRAWTTAQKQRVVGAAVGLGRQALDELLVREGLRPDQLDAWRDATSKALESAVDDMPERDLDAERVTTDKSLESERTKTDGELEKREAVIQARADSGVEAARQTADNALNSARTEEDRSLDEARLPEVGRDVVTSARERADAILEAERGGADLETLKERLNLKAVLNALLREERSKTDRDLSLERLGAGKRARSIQLLVEGRSADRSGRGPGKDNRRGRTRTGRVSGDGGP